MEESEWIRRIHNGETQLLNLLIQKHYQGIQTYCYWRTRDCEEAKDLTQETFYRFCRYIHNYRDAGKCRAYLYTIARHLCRDHLIKRTPSNWTSLHEGEEPAGSSLILSVEEQVENRQLVHEWLSQLPEEQREPVFMRYCLDLTFREIAGITGVNSYIIQYRVKRGLLALRQYEERSAACGQEKSRHHHPLPKELPFGSR